MPPSAEPRPALAAQFDELRRAVAKCDAIAHATQEIFDGTMWAGDVDPQRIDRVAHLIGATAEAAEAAVAAVDRLHTVIADQQPAPDDEHWGGEGTASGT